MKYDSQLNSNQDVNLAQVFTLSILSSYYWAITQWTCIATEQQLRFVVKYGYKFLHCSKYALQYKQEQRQY